MAIVRLSGRKTDIDGDITAADRRRIAGFRVLTPATTALASGVWTPVAAVSAVYTVTAAAAITWTDADAVAASWS